MRTYRSSTSVAALLAADLTSYAHCCVDLELAAIAANDHLVFTRPWSTG